MNLWWDKNSKYNILHKIHEFRLDYIKEFVKPGQVWLDVGCGGGLLSQSIARMGARVVSVDIEPEIEEYARFHDLNISVHKCDIMDFESDEKFDGIICFEFLEHVVDPFSVIEKLGKLSKQVGYIFLSTINKTIVSYIGAILFAEKVGWVPKGIHNWNMFIDPNELGKCLCRNYFAIDDVRGLSWNLLDWRWSKNLDINYFIRARKLM
jgi:2-polyprenyl-6-hydroxyphenyl methylase / 3-demethylubiquinone-9 3-methyltransferase